MAIDAEFVDHLAAGGYHPRTSRHSDFLSLIIIRDLIDQCPLLRQRAKRGEIVAKLRHHQRVGHADWVVDVAIGTCPGRPIPPQDQEIRFAAPVMIQIAIELKSIFTEHGKARLNRLRDFNSFHGYADEYNPRTVTAGFLAVNSSRYFYSPLRDDNDITDHTTGKWTPRQVAENAISAFRSIHLRNATSDVPGMEAVGVIVVEHDNLAFHPDPQSYSGFHRPSRVAPAPPSLSVGDPLNYYSMIQRICENYTQRFSRSSV
jgi:hypothetical protein